jgi:cytochrome c oxidase subunit 3
MNPASEHTSHLAHHFSTAEQQRDSAKLGLWIFLVTEVLLFGGLFAAYSIYRAWNPDMFYNAHKALNLTLGTINTIILISSSLTMALAIRSIQLNNKNRSLMLLLSTLLLAVIFLTIKYFEYRHKFWDSFPGNSILSTGFKALIPTSFLHSIS